MDKNVLSEEDIHWIAKIFSECGELVQNKEVLCGGLGILPSEMEDIKAKVGLDRCGSYGAFVLVLQGWISKYGTKSTITNLISVLKDGNFNFAADAIICGHKEASIARQTSQINEPSLLLQSQPEPFFGVPEKINLFTGRTEELEQLHQSLLKQSKDNERELTVITTLSGMGGIGKTTLSVHYAWTFYEVKKFYSNVVWINDESETTLADSIFRLAEELKISTINEGGIRLESPQILTKAYTYFRKSVTLFVFDNVSEYNTIKNYLPVCKPFTRKPYVLITSRHKSWNDKTDVIELNVFREVDSVQFLADYLKLGCDDELLNYAAKISAALQNLPLAVRQAGAYIKAQVVKQHGDSCHDILAEQMKLYLVEFNSCSKSVINCEYWLETADKYEQTAYTTWNVTLKTIKVQNSLAVKIMELISYFNPENIPINLFYYCEGRRYRFFSKFRPLVAFFNRNSDRVEYNDIINAIQLLSDYSMIKRDTCKPLFSVHRVLQKAIRLKIEERKSYSKLKEAIQLIKIPLKMKNYDDFEGVCLLHSQSIWECSVHARLKSRQDRLGELINRKRYDSIQQHIQELQFLINQNHCDQALQKFKTFREGVEFFDKIASNILSKLIDIIVQKIVDLCKSGFVKIETSDFVVISKLMNTLHNFLKAFLSVIRSKKSKQDFSKVIILVGLVHEAGKVESNRPDLTDYIFSEGFSITSLLYDHFCAGATPNVSKSAFFIAICLLETLKSKDKIELSSDLSPALLGWIEKCNFIKNLEGLDEVLESYQLLFDYYYKHLRQNIEMILMTGIIIVKFLKDPTEIVNLCDNMTALLNAFCVRGFRLESTLISKFNLNDFPNCLVSSSKNPELACIKNQLLLLHSALNNYKDVQSHSRLWRNYSGLATSTAGLIKCLVELNQINEIMPAVKEYKDFLYEFVLAGNLHFNDDQFELTDSLYHNLDHANLSPIKNDFSLELISIYKILYEYYKILHIYSNDEVRNICSLSKIRSLSNSRISELYRNLSIPFNSTSRLH